MRPINQNPPTRFPDRPIADAPLSWRVAHVRSRQEKAFADDLVELGIEYYLPFITKVTRRRDNGKLRKSVTPLFPGYISFSGDRSTVHTAYATGRVVGIIEVKNQERFANELAQIYSLLEKGIVLEPFPSKYVRGTKVVIQAGPLKGVSGVVLKVKNKSKLVLSVEGLGRAAMTIDVSLIRSAENPSRNC